MEDETYHKRPYVTPTSGDYVLQMEPDSVASTPPITSSGDNTKLGNNTSEVEVCYPYQPQLPDQHSTVEIDQLKSYTKDDKEDENVEPDFKLERQLTAKLDDLLESNERASTSRRFSLYGENIKVVIYTR